MRSFARFLSLALVSAFLLLVALHTGATLVEGRSLEHVLADLRAKGEPVTLSEVAPPLVPDERNGALVYQRAFKLYPKSSDDRSAPAVTEFISGKPASQSLAALNQVRAAVAQARPALDLVVLAAAMPECRFPINYEAGAGALFPHLPGIRQSARLLAARSRLEAMEGRSRDSLADIGTILDMSHQISGEPVLISRLVEYSCLAIASRALQHSMEVAPPDPEAAADMYRKLAAYDVYGPFTRALEGERCFGLWAFDLVQRDPQQAAVIFSAGGSEGAPGGAVPGAVASGLVALAGPVLKRDEIYYLNAMQSAIDQAQARAPSTRMNLVKTAAASIPRYAVVSRAMLPSVDRIVQKRDEAAVRLGEAEWALALNAIRQRTGRYPSSLAEAQRLTSWALPGDSFVSQPFRYRLEPGGFLLYSVGRNGKDDGGAGLSGNDRPSTGRGTADDIAWRVPEYLGTARPPSPGRLGGNAPSGPASGF